MLKGIITEEDWNSWKEDITIDYVRDNHFTELKDTELIRERMQTMDQVQQYVGEYFSKEWVMRNVLRLSDEDMKNMKDQMRDEASSGEVPDDQEQQQNGDEDGGNR